MPYLHVFNFFITTKFRAVEKNFLHGMIDKIKERFPSTEMVMAFSVLGMRPLNMLPESEVENWGNAEITKLC